MCAVVSENRGFHDNDHKWSPVKSAVSYLHCCHERIAATRASDLYKWLGDPTYSSVKYAMPYLLGQNCLHITF